MKKIIPLICAISSLGILGISCSGNSKASASDSDSIADQSIEIEADTVPADTLPEYFSDDLKAYRIKGPVIARSQVSYEASIVYPEPMEALSFNEEGVLTNPDGNIEITRDDEGFNHSIYMHESDGTEWTMTYTDFNEKGFPTKATIKESGPMGTGTTTVTWSRYGYDSHGNWTVRRTDFSMDFTDLETEEKSHSTGSWKETCSYSYR